MVSLFQLVGMFSWKKKGAIWATLYVLGFPGKGNMNADISSNSSSVCSSIILSSLPHSNLLK